MPENTVAEAIALDVLTKFRELYESVDTREEWGAIIEEFWAPYGGREAAQVVVNMVAKQIAQADPHIAYANINVVGYALSGCLMLGALLAVRKGDVDKLEAMLALPAPEKGINKERENAGEGEWVNKEGYDFVD